MSRGRLFLIGVLALLVLGGLSHARHRRLVESIKDGTFRPTPAAVLEAVRAHLTNDSDIERYRAYSQAMLGRPYRSHFVRTRADWEALFAQSADVDPELLPEVQPARNLVPYRDFLVEYPPAFFLVALPPALLTADLDSYAAAFKLLMALFLGLAAWWAARFVAAPGVARPWAAWTGGAVLALGVVATHRYDAAVAVGVAGALWCAALGRPILCGLLLGAAVAIKGAPVLFLPLIGLYVFTERGLRATLLLLVTAGAVVVASLLPAVLGCGAALLDALSYHRLRPLHIESTLGALLGLGRIVSPGWVEAVHSFGSINLSGPAVGAAGALSSLLMLVGIGAVYLVTWRQLQRTSGLHRRLALLDGVILIGLVFTVLGKVFSPQYLVWILPFCVAGALARRRGFAATLILLMVATQVIYPIAYAWVIKLEPPMLALVVLRNLGLGIWGLLLFRAGAADAAAVAPGDAALPDSLPDAGAAPSAPELPLPAPTSA